MPGSVFSPVILVTFRMLHGLALGGEYGGAAIYVAEHGPDHERGQYTASTQTMATVGMFVALAVILITRLGFGDETRDRGSARRSGSSTCCLGPERIH
jgi:MFS family permease